MGLSSGIDEIRSVASVFWSRHYYEYLKYSSSARSYPSYHSYPLEPQATAAIEMILHA